MEYPINFPPTVPSIQAGDKCPVTREQVEVEKIGPGQDRMKIACKLAVLICKTKAQQRLFVLLYSYSKRDTDPE